MDSLEGRNELISFLVFHWQTVIQVMASSSEEASPYAAERYLWSLTEYVSKDTSELYFSNIFFNGSIFDLQLNFHTKVLKPYLKQKNQYFFLLW